MDQNGQNAPFYPHAAPQHHSYPPNYNFHHLTGAFNSGDEEASRLEGSSPPQSQGYAPPSATEGFHTTDSAQGLDYDKAKEERDTGNIVTIDPMIKSNSDNFLQVLEGVSKRLLQLETVVQGLERSIEGLKCAEREKQDESNNRLLRLELLVKEVHTGVQLLQDNQKLDGAISQLKKLHPVDDKASIGGEMQMPPVNRWQQPKETQPYLGPSETSEQSTQHVQARSLPQLPPHHPNAPSPHNMLPPPPSMNEPSKPTTQQPYFSHLHQHTAGPPGTGQPLPPQHSMQAPSFPYQTQGQAPSAAPPQGLYNLPVEATLYGHMQSHQQHLAPNSSYIPELPQYPSQVYGGGARHLVSQEMQHSSQQYGPSGPQVYEPVVGRVGATPVFVPPYVQSLPQSSPPASMYETANGVGYSTPPYRAAQPSGGGGSHSRVPSPQPLQSTLPAPVGSALTSRHQVDEVTERVISMGFQREQVRAVVRGLTDIGQPVDVNVVVDKLRLGGASPQLPRG
eukprot:c23125_g1_i1 orf=221-1744(-)